MMFLNFLHIFAIFLEFPITGRVQMDRTITFLFLYHSQHVPHRFGLKYSHNVVFKFLHFFAIFWEFLIPNRVGMDRTDILFFFGVTLSLSRPVMKPE